MKVILKFGDKLKAIQFGLKGGTDNSGIIMKILKESKLKVQRKKKKIFAKKFLMIVIKENVFLPTSIPHKILFIELMGYYEN